MNFCECSWIIWGGNVDTLKKWWIDLRRFFKSFRSRSSEIYDRIHSRIGCHAATSLNHIDDRDYLFFRWCHDVFWPDEILATQPESETRSVTLSCNASEKISDETWVIFCPDVKLPQSAIQKRIGRCLMGTSDLCPGSYVITSKMTKSKTWRQILWGMSTKISPDQFSNFMCETNSEQNLTFDLS